MDPAPATHRAGPFRYLSKPPSAPFHDHILTPGSSGSQPPAGCSSTSECDKRARFCLPPSGRLAAQSACCPCPPLPSARPTSGPRRGRRAQPSVSRPDRYRPSLSDIAPWRLPAAIRDCAMRFALRLTQNNLHDCARLCGSVTAYRLPGGHALVTQAVAAGRGDSRRLPGFHPLLARRPGPHPDK